MSTPSKRGPLGRRLTHLRWAVGLSRTCLARRAGVSRHLIQSLEQGRTRNPTLLTLIGLANGLDVEIHELFEGVLTREPDESECDEK